MNNIPDQFLPYKGIFGCDGKVFSQGRYEGTLFRFPLRAIPSELSQTLYSDDKVRSLFHSFIADAHLILLFLRNIESIELYEREKSEPRPRRIFQAKICDNSSKRREFYATVTPEPVTVTYPLTIEIEMDSSVQRHSFLVTNYCFRGEVSSHFEKLLTDEDLSYLPSVGVAMALPPEIDHETPEISGHVF